jgi:hypothetical protein
MQRVLCVPLWIEAFPSLAISMVPTGPTVRFAVVDGPPFELVKQLTGSVENEVLVFWGLDTGLELIAVKANSGQKPFQDLLY